jgi:lipopolysaccharide transport system permease protein
MMNLLSQKIRSFSRFFNLSGENVSVIEARSGWQAINFKELSDYRDLFLFLVWRDIKVLYAQTILGFLWAILQPLIQIIIFSIIFGKVARISTDGIPYILFSTAAIIPWTYMSQSMTASSQSLVLGQNMLGKIYFPRLISAGIGLWLSALAIRFRDVKLAMRFVIRMLIYSAPIVYSASSIPETYRFIYSLNPIVAVIEGFRACLLGIQIPWLFIWPGVLTAIFLLIGGALYFKRMERVFVDVI